MRIFFIVDETPFFLPDWLEEVISKLPPKYEVVGVTPLITKNKQTFSNHLLKNLYRLGSIQIIKLVIYAIKAKLKNHSVQSVALKNSTKVISSTAVNDEKYLNKIRKLKPDVIISSCSQIFKEDLLKLPRIACINRHSALLPSYGGVLPIFQAMLNNEKEVGVTIHKMVLQIDKGEILYQVAFPIKKDDTLFLLYKKAYKSSVGATLGALRVLKTKTKPVIVKKTKSSYYSFPKSTDWERFFQKGNKFI